MADQERGREWEEHDEWWRRERARRRMDDWRVKARWVRRLRLARRREPWEEHEPWVKRFAHRWAQTHGFWCGHNLMATHIRRRKNRRERRDGRGALLRELAVVGCRARDQA